MNKQQVTFEDFQVGTGRLLQGAFILDANGKEALIFNRGLGRWHVWMQKGSVSRLEFYYDFNAAAQKAVDYINA